MPNVIDDKIKANVGKDLKAKLDSLIAADPGKPGISVVVRRLLWLGIKHQEECEKTTEEKKARQA